MSPVLELSAVTAGYGRHHPVLHGIDLTINSGEVLGLVGMNGAGKSTLLKAICGSIDIRAGRVAFNGDDITKTGTAELARRGISVLAEGHQVIRPLSVEENLQMSTMSLRGPAVRRRLAEAAELIDELFPILQQRRKQLAGLLSGGEQQMLSVARAIIQKPKLLLLDEPSLGLAPLVVDRIYASLATFTTRGISMLIVEQNSNRMADSCHRLVVLREGRITATGSPAELVGDTLNAAYFG